MQAVGYYQCLKVFHCMVGFHGVNCIVWCALPVCTCVEAVNICTSSCHASLVNRTLWTPRRYSFIYYYNNFCST